MSLDELVTHLEVQTNILNDQHDKQARQERGAKAMREAWGVEDR